MILFSLHHPFTYSLSTRISRSLLLPTKAKTLPLVLDLARLYHDSTAFLYEDSLIQGLFYLERSNTTTTPWHPLKQVDTIDRYFYEPAVSQTQSLIGLLLMVMHFILKSIVVTRVYLLARNQPSVQRQNIAVFPTFTSPTRIILYRASSFPIRNLQPIHSTIYIIRSVYSVRLWFAQIYSIYQIYIHKKNTKMQMKKLIISLYQIYQLFNLFLHVYLQLINLMAITKTLLAVLAVMLVVNSEVLPFDNTAIQKIFQQKNPALFLFTSENDASKNARAALSVYDEAGSPVVLTVSDPSDGHGLFDRLAEYLGVDTKNTPVVLFMGDKNDKYFFDAQEITKDTLSSFVSRVQAGEVEQFLKSAPIPQTNDEPVKIGVGKNFKSMVLDSDKEFLVEFYAPWCGHCKNLSPHYDEAAKKLSNNPNIFLVKVDSTQNEVAGVEIQGFPTLKFWGKDKSVAPIDYDGGRNAEGILSWLKQHTEYQWVEPEQSGQEDNSDL